MAEFPSINPNTLSDVRGWWHCRSGGYVNNGTAVGEVADGTNITQFDDVSGNARHLTGGAGTGKIKFRTSQFNGIPALSWESTDEALACASFWSGTAMLHLAISVPVSEKQTATYNLTSTGAWTHTG